jgi:ElaA protein
MGDQMRWEWHHFDELNTAELYEILRLRAEIFVVEQDCVYQDLDGLDPECWHVMGYLDGDLVAYTRILPPGMNYALPAIGRVVIHEKVRGTGLGRELMDRSIACSRRLFGDTGIQLGGQSYLRAFYESLGFVVTGEEYLEDGIPHFHMVLEPEGNRQTGERVNG